MSDGKVEIEVKLDDKGVKTQVVKLDRDLSRIGRTMPKNFTGNARAVEQRTAAMGNSMRNVLSTTERNALAAGNGIARNLSGPIGSTSQSLIRQFQRTGQGISQPLVRASNAGSAAFRSLDRSITNVGNTMPRTFGRSTATVDRQMTALGNSMRNTLSTAERNAMISGTRIGGNLQSSIGQSSHRIIQDFQRTGQGITQPLIRASYAGSTAFRNLADNSTSSTNNIRSGFSRVSGGVQNFGRTVISTTRDAVGAIGKVGPSFVTASNTIGGAIERGLTAPFAAAVGMVKQYGAMIGVLSVGSLVAAGVNRLSAIEDARIALGVMLDDTKKVDAFMTDVLAFAKTTPFAFPQLATAAKNMVAFGMDTKKVVPTLKAIGDAAAASGAGAQGLDQIADAFGSIQIGSKLTMLQVNRLTTNGVPALKILANQAGISTDEMFKKISSGTVDSKQAIDTLVAGIENGSKGIAGETSKMGGVMEKMKDSWRGSIDSMKSSISSTMATIMEPAIPHIRDFMKWFSEQFKKLPDVINSIKEKVKPIIEQFKPIFFGIVDGVQNTVIPAIKDMLPAFQPVVVGILGGLKALGTFIVSTVIPAFGKMGTFFKENKTLVQTLAVVFASLIGSIMVIGKVYPVIMMVSDAFKAFKAAGGIIKGITAAMKVLNLAFLSSPIVWIILGIIAVVAAAAFLIYKYWDPISAFFKDLWEGIKDISAAVWEWMKGVWAGAVAIFKGYWSAIFAGAKWLWDGIKSVTASVVDWFKSAWSSIKEFFSNLWDGIVNIATAVWDAVTSVWDKAMTNLKNVFQPLIDFFSGLFGGVKDTASGIWGDISSYFETVWENIKVIAENAWTLIKNVVLAPILLLIDLLTGNFDRFKSDLSQIWDNIKNAASNIWGALVNIISSFVGTIVSVGKKLFTNFVNTIVGFCKAIVDTVVNVLSSIGGFFEKGMQAIKIVIDNVWNFILDIWMAAAEWLVNSTGGNFETIRNFVLTAMDSIKETIDTVWNYIRETFANAIDFIKALVTLNFEGMKNAISNQMDLIKTTIGYIWSDIKTVFSNVLAAIITYVKQKFDDMKNSAKQKMDNTKSNISNAWENIKKTFLDTLINIITTVRNKFNEIKESIGTKMTDAKNKIIEIWDSVKTFFTNIDLKQIGKDIIQGLIDGISSKIKAVTDVVKNVTDAITGKIRNILKIESPSKFMRDMIGKNMMLGWQIGIDREKQATIKKAEQATDWMKPDVPVVSGFINRMKGMAAPVGNVMPISAVSGASAKPAASSGNDADNLSKLVGAINKLASRPARFAIDGHEFIEVTADRMDSAIAFNTSRRDRF